MSERKENEILLALQEKLDEYDQMMQKMELLLNAQLSDKISQNFRRQSTVEKHTSPAQLKDLKVKNLNRVIGHFLFLLVFMCWSMYAHGDEKSFYLVNRLQAMTVDRVFSTPDGQQLQFGQIASIPVMFYWLKNTFADSVITELYDNGQEISPSIDMHYVGIANKVLDPAIRLRQLRVRANTCSVPVSYASTISACFAEYSESREEKSTFYGGLKPASTFPNQSNANAAQSSVTSSTLSYGLPPWKWSDASKTRESAWQGRSVFYEGSGYMIDVPVNYSQWVATIDDLKRNLFVDRHTRVLMIDFNIYNAAVDMHVVARLAFEFLETGGVRPTYNFSPIRLNRYSSTQKRDGNSVMALEIFLFSFIAFYVAREFKNIYKRCNLVPKTFDSDSNLCHSEPALCKKGCLTCCSRIHRGCLLYMSKKYMLTPEYINSPTNDYQVDVWRFVTWCILLLFLAFMGIRFTSIALYNIHADSFGKLYMPLQYMVVLQDVERYLMGVNSFLLWFKVFKYLQYIEPFQVFFRLFSNAIQNLFWFALLFIVFFLGLGQMGFLFFLQNVREFRSLPISLLTLFSSLFGGLNAEDLAQSNRFIGPMYFIFVNMLVVLVLVNVFLAILNKSFDDACDASAADPETLHLDDCQDWVEYWKHVVNNLVFPSWNHLSLSEEADVKKLEEKLDKTVGFQSFSTHQDQGIKGNSI